MIRRSQILFVALVAALMMFLAACGTTDGGGNGNGGTDLTQEEVTSSINGSIGAVTNATADLQTDPGVAAFTSPQLSAFIGSTSQTFSLAQLATDPQVFLSAITTAADENLPRGQWEYDATASQWNNIATSNDLVLMWNFDVFDPSSGTTSTYEGDLTLDWDNSTSASGSSATVDVISDTSTSTTVEVPTAMRVLLETGSVGGSKSVSADLVMTFGWYDGCTAAGSQAINDIVDFSLNGTVGSADQVSFNNITYSVDDASGNISSSGEVSASTASESASFDWSLNLNGDILRQNCYFSNIDLTDGDFTFTVSTQSSGVSDTFTFTVNFNNVQVDATTGAFTSAEIDGSVTINGNNALTFAGTFDDADGDNTWGDNVTLNFADGTSANLEAYIQGSVSATSR